MPQSMLALLALMLVSLLAFQQQRNALHTGAQQIRREVAMQGTGVAEDLLGEIGLRYFDQATVEPGKKVAKSELTRAPFSGDNSHDVIDDYHGYSDTRVRAVGLDTLRYEVSVRVAYADDGNPDQEITDTSIVTKTKKATVTVQNLDLPNAPVARLSRSYGCGSACNW